MIYWLYKAWLLRSPSSMGWPGWPRPSATGIPVRAKVIDTNLQNAFPERDAAWRADIAARFYRQFTDVTMQILRLPHAAQRIQTACDDRGPG